jgi:hypothetical protein
MKTLLSKQEWPISQSKIFLSNLIKYLKGTVQNYAAPLNKLLENNKNMLEIRLKPYRGVVLFSL